ncbi:hypothetical protein EGI26_06720 [Lacihabitans sp. CCS-44]|nr:hypothetical protein [Lacihabitans sp. CCS-44]
MCALPGGHSFFSKKKPNHRTDQKNTFCAASAVRNDPLKNFGSNIAQVFKFRLAKIFQRTAQKILGIISI